MINPAHSPSLRLGVTGATGFVGREVIRQATAAGHSLIRYSRSAGSPANGSTTLRAFGQGIVPDVSGLDAIIHLAGEPVLGLWTAKKKAAILQSRVENTRLVIDGLAALPPDQRPHTLICASAIGLYGDGGEAWLGEDTPCAPGFLADVVKHWEAEMPRAEALGVRVVALRIGMVLGPGGGGWPLLRRVFSCGLGGRLGHGRQWVPWIHVEDVAGLAIYAACTPQVVGPYNTTAPHPVTNAEFTKIIAQNLRRPAFAHVPSFVLKYGLGEISGLFLNSVRTSAAKTLASGYSFKHPEFAPAIAALVKP